MTFRCGHPKTPENSNASGLGYRQCRFCERVHRIVRTVERDQAKINRGQRVFGIVGQ
jgi:hypothetical protein